MKQHHLVALGSVAATLGATLVLAGCPGNNPGTNPTPGPTVAPTTSPNLAMQYLFPNKADGTYTYDWVAVTEQPGVTATSTDSKEIVLKTTKLTGTEAVIEMSVADVSLATYSMLVKDHGVEVTRTERNPLTSTTETSKELYTNDSFTETGTTLSAASGSVGAIKVKKVGSESVAAATESFTTLKLQSLESTPSATPKFKWIAKGMGYMGIKNTEVSTSSAGGGIATESTEILLKSYTK
ncbi:MAG TPA: hypothetical protein V6D00_14110 [Pantanalinema sp.]